MQIGESVINLQPESRDIEKEMRSKSLIICWIISSVTGETTQADHRGFADVYRTRGELAGAQDCAARVLRAARGGGAGGLIIGFPQPKGGGSGIAFRNQSSQQHGL